MIFAFPRVNGVNGVNGVNAAEDSEEDDVEDVEEDEEEDEDEDEDDEEDWPPLAQPDGRIPSRTRTTRIEAPRAMNTCLPRRSNTAEEPRSTLACPPPLHTTRPFRTPRTITVVTRNELCFEGQQRLHAPAPGVVARSVA